MQQPQDRQIEKYSENRSSDSLEVVNLCEERWKFGQIVWTVFFLQETGCKPRFKQVNYIAPWPVLYVSVFPSFTMADSGKAMRAEQWANHVPDVGLSSKVTYHSHCHKWFEEKEICNMNCKVAALFLGSICKTSRAWKNSLPLEVLPFFFVHRMLSQWNGFQTT